MGKNSILERGAVHAGQVIMQAGEPYKHAHIIQSGEVTAKIREDGKDLICATYGPGTIIGERCLMSDDPMIMTLEAKTDTTLITVTRQDFEKKLAKTENTVRSVLKHMNGKLQKAEACAIAEARRKAIIDGEALEIVRHLTRNLSADKQAEYEAAMMPHFNELVLVLREVQERHRHQAQQKYLEQVQAKAKLDEAAAAEEQLIN